MKIKIIHEPNALNCRETISLEDLGLEKSEWDNLTHGARHDIIQDYLDKNDLTYTAILDSFEEIEEE